MNLVLARSRFGTGPRSWASSRALTTIVLAWALSRAVVLGAAVWAETLAERNPRLTSGSDSPLLRSLTSWDGWWYLGIVRDGYHAQALSGSYHDYAFFPLWPAVIRLLSLPWPAVDGAVAVVVANLLFLAALGLLYRLTADVLDEERALAAVVVLAVFPFSWVFSMAYGESLFLVLSLGALLTAERGYAGRAATLALLAGTVRLPGLLLVVPAALVLWQRLPDRRVLAWLVLVPVGAAAFLLYVSMLTGSGAGYMDAQAAWGRAGTSAATGGGSLGEQLDWFRLSLLVTFLAYVFLLVYLRADRIPVAYGAFAIVTLGSVFATGNITSIGRLGMVAFPFVWLVAGRRSLPFRRLWLPVSAGLMAVSGALAFAGWFQP